MGFAYEDIGDQWQICVWQKIYKDLIALIKNERKTFIRHEIYSGFLKLKEKWIESILEKNNPTEAFENTVDAVNYLKNKQLIFEIFGK